MKVFTVFEVLCKNNKNKFQLTDNSLILLFFFRIDK